MIKLLIDKYARDYAAVDIPTGELYRSIAQDQLLRCRKELYAALEDRIKEAFMEGYESVRYYYDDCLSDPDEEWERCKGALLK